MRVDAWKPLSCVALRMRLRREGSHPPTASRVGRSLLSGAAGSAEREHGDERVALEPHRRPAVAAVAALPELPVGEAGKEATVGREERIWHRRQRLRQSAGQRLPGFTIAPPVDPCLRVAAPVRGEGAGARRDIPPVGVVRVDCDRPRVVAVAAVVGALPALACIRAEGGAATARLVRPTGHLWMPGERVHVPLGAGTVVLPAPPAVARAHQAAELDPNEEQVSVVWARGDPAHMGRPRPRREAPIRPRRQLEQRFELTPAVAAVVASEQPARLGAGVHRTIGGADGEREYARLGQPAVDPALTAVEGATHTTLASPTSSMRTIPSPVAAYNRRSNSSSGTARPRAARRAPRFRRSTPARP